MVEAADDVSFNDPMHLLLARSRQLMQVGLGGVTTSLRPKAMAFRTEVALEDWF